MDMESQRRITSSKLEKTILTNRNMNILLKKKLSMIEVDRKRALAAVTRSQKEVKAELRAKKDEKFNLMLKYQKNKSGPKGKAKKSPPQHPENTFANDIEGELFTNGLINAPGVNSRMNRLSQRRRILPDFESDEEDRSTISDSHDINSNANPEDVSYELTVTENPSIRPQTVPDSIIRKPVPSVIKRTRRLSDESEAAVLMTSGVVTFLDEHAGFKQVAKPDDTAAYSPKQPETLTLPITGFSIHSQMRPGFNNEQITSQSKTSRKGNEMFADKQPTRKMSVQFSRHRKSIETAQDIFGEREESQSHNISKIAGMGSRSRLSVVKSRIESNEKAFLLRLRIQNQKQENEEVAKKVWDFIGQRPTSMFVARKKAGKENQDTELLTEAEEEMKRNKFKAAANKTSADS